MNNPPILSVSNLTKKYDDLTILENFTFDIKKNEVVSIIGPSGSGKSTFLRTLNALEPVSSGKMTFNNQTFELPKLTSKEKIYLRKNMNMVFQHYNLFNNKTALENITESLQIVHKMPKKDAHAKAMDMLRLVNLVEKAHDYPHQLSGGQQQRVGIARALAVNPDIILLDEPTSALDPELIGEVVDLIKTMATNDSTMIVVTHEMSLAREISDRVLLMDQGNIVTEGPPEDFFINSTNLRLQKFLKRLKV